MTPKKKFEKLIESPNWVRRLGKTKHTTNADAYQYLLELTDFLPEDSSVSQRAWHVENNIYTRPKCSVCENYPAFNSKGYREYCSIQCIGQSSSVVDKRKATSLQNWGTDNPSKSNVIKEKIKDVFMEKYGVEWSLQSAEVQKKRLQTNLERYGTEYPQQLEDTKEKVKQTNLRLYGVEHVMQSEDVQRKSRETNFKNLGVEYPTQSPEVMEKIKETNLERYGHENVFGSPEIQERIKNLNLDHYGVEYAAQSEEVKEKIRQTNLERYGVEYGLSLPETHEKSKVTIKEKYGEEYDIISQVPEIKEKIRNSVREKYGPEYNWASQVPVVKEKRQNTIFDRYNRNHYSQVDILEESLIKLNDYDWMYGQHITQKRTLTELADELGVVQTTVSNYMKNIHDIEVQNFYQSYQEVRVGEFLKEHASNLVLNTRSIISPYELDIYLPDHNVAIEYCGLYWHSEQQKSKHYHKMKTDLCREKGIRLIHIFEDEWLEKEELIKEKLLNILGKSANERVYARKTRVVEVGKKDKAEFFNVNHIQGDGPSSINYGLEYNNELVAVLGFIKQKDHFALNRYATSKNVVGGFSKLLKYFEKEYNNPPILTFADLRWSEGDLYYNSGFTLDKTIPQDYFWCKAESRWHKFNWRHVGMKQKLENYDPTLSETQNMHNHGFYRIWDCGKLRFVKNVDS